MNSRTRVLRIFMFTTHKRRSRIFPFYSSISRRCALTAFARKRKKLANPKVADSPGVDASSSIRCASNCAAAASPALHSTTAGVRIRPLRARIGGWDHGYMRRMAAVTNGDGAATDRDGLGGNGPGVGLVRLACGCPQRASQGDSPSAAGRDPSAEKRGGGGGG